MNITQDTNPPPYNARDALLEVLAQRVEAWAEAQTTFEKRDVALACAQIIRREK